MSILAGVRVLELAAIGPVPWCAMLLADMGASVVRIDRPGAARSETAIERGRSRVCLDLKEDGGRDQARALISRADVLLEGMRPGVAERLGLGPQACMRLNPALVFGRMTGWGQSGPLADRAGHDINYIALSGALHAIGPRDRPVPPLNLVGDFGGGGAFLAIGVLAALLKARETGVGEVVDAAMLDGAAALMAAPYKNLGLGKWKDERESNLLDGGAPWYGIYQTQCGGFVAVGAIEPDFYAELLAGLGLAASEVPDRGGPENWPAIRALFTQRFASRTRAQWAAVFDASDACVTPVLSMTEAPQHPHNQARQVFAQWGRHPAPAPTPRFHHQPSRLAGASEDVEIGELIDRWGKAQA